MGEHDAVAWAEVLYFIGVLAFLGWMTRNHDGSE